MVKQTSLQGHPLLQQADLAGEIERLREDLRNECDRHVRTLADFKNYRRRVERDGNTLAAQRTRELLLAVLAIVDDVDNALAWASRGEQTLVKGVPMIHQKLLAMLAVHGVRRFDSVGTPFTPDLHQAIGVEKRAAVKSGTVLEVARQGYLWNEELLRAAQVLVAE